MYFSVLCLQYVTGADAKPLWDLFVREPVDLHCNGSAIAIGKCRLIMNVQLESEKRLHQAKCRIRGPPQKHLKGDGENIHS